MKFDTETEAAIVNFSKGYCQSKGLELSRWEEVVEFVKERFSFHHKDSKFNDIEIGKASFIEIIDCVDFERKVIERTIKEMDEKFTNNSLDNLIE